MKKQLHAAMVAVPLLILWFMFTYFVGYTVGEWTHAVMYGVYSREKEV